MPLTGARRMVMFMKETTAVRGVQEAGSGLDAGNSRQLHALATGAGYYGAVGTSTSRGDNNARDCHCPGRRDIVPAAVAQKRLPRAVAVA